VFAVLFNVPQQVSRTDEPMPPSTGYVLKISRGSPSLSVIWIMRRTENQFEITILRN